MRDYTPRYAQMPHSVAMRVKWTIKDYPRLKQEADACIARTPTQTETPEAQRQRDITATERTNLKYAELMKTIRAIDDALVESVAPQDRQTIMDHILHDKRWPLDRSESTYKRIQNRFMYAVAKKLQYI